jgi:hypothetical protein
LIGHALVRGDEFQPEHASICAHSSRLQQVGSGGIVCLTGVGAGGAASNLITADDDSGNKK